MSNLPDASYIGDPPCPFCGDNACAQECERATENCECGDRMERDCIHDGDCEKMRNLRWYKKMVGLYAEVLAHYRHESCPSGIRLLSYKLEDDADCDYDRFKYAAERLETGEGGSGIRALDCACGGRRRRHCVEGDCRLTRWREHERDYEKGSNENDK